MALTTRPSIENAQSGTHVTFGRFRLLHLGDVTWNVEHNLMCPSNPLGTLDLFMVSHDGQAISSGPVLVHALAPRVMIMNNGTNTRNGFSKTYQARPR